MACHISKDEAKGKKMKILNILGPKIDKPQYFDKDAFVIVFLLNDIYNKFDGKINGSRYSAHQLLFGCPVKLNKDFKRGLKNLLETKKLDGKSIDTNVMRTVIEPLIFAQLKPEHPLSIQINQIVDIIESHCFDVDFFNTLSESAKLYYFRKFSYGIKSTKTKNDIKKLVLTSQFATLADVRKVFCDKYIALNDMLSQEECNIIWGKLKSHLMGLKGVKYFWLNNSNANISVEQVLLERLVVFLAVWLPNFNKEIETINKHDNKYQIINEDFVNKIDEIIKYKLPAAMEKDAVRKLQLEKDALDKQYDAEIQALKAVVALHKTRIQNIKTAKQETESKLKAAEEENKHNEAERIRAEFEHLVAKMGIEPADLLEFQNEKQY